VHSECDFNNRPDDFVTEHYRWLYPLIAWISTPSVQIASAQPTGFNTHDHFTGSGSWHGKVSDEGAFWA
jgi:hypothetical protein